MQALLLYSAGVGKTFPEISFLMELSTLLSRCEVLLFKAGEESVPYSEEVEYVLFRHQLEA